MNTMPTFRENFFFSFRHWTNHIQKSMAVMVILIIAPVVLPTIGFEENCEVCHFSRQTTKAESDDDLTNCVLRFRMAINLRGFTFCLLY